MLHSLAGACGDYCGKCANYGTRCHGCTLDAHPECHFLQCTLARGVEHCGLCEDFPCQALASLVPDDRPDLPVAYHIECLRQRAWVGTRAWLWEMAERWGAPAVAKGTTPSPAHPPV